MNSKINPIIQDFRKKSETYYEDIYVRGKDIHRIQRLSIVNNLLSKYDLKGKNVLDAGSGPAVLYDTIIKLNGKYTALDISPHNIESAKKRIPDLNGIVGSITEMPLDDNMFDFVLSVGCLEYVREIEKAFSEILRVLKNNGIFIASFANGKCPGRLWNEYFIKYIYRFKHYSEKDSFYSRYLTTVNNVQRKMLNNNFNIIGVEYFGSIFFGYPFSGIKLFYKTDCKLAKLQSLYRLSSEFIIIGKKNA